jgi:hypothetical protein
MKNADTTNETTTETAVKKFVPKIKNHVTIPLLKFANNVEVYVKFTAETYIGRIVDDKKEPPTMARVVNLETGELNDIILGTVLLSTLSENYPDNGYIGKAFAIKKHAPEGTRAYSLWDVSEIEG